MARQLAQMLNCVDPKIACAEKMLGKYVGESESNTSAIFSDAEDDEKRVTIFQNKSNDFSFFNVFALAWIAKQVTRNNL